MNGTPRVAETMSALPVPEQSPFRPEVLATLDERRDRIIALIEKAALDVGAELIQAKKEHPREFLEWVSTKLPFGIDKAERLMAISRAFGSADDWMRKQLPPAWTALFELSRLPIEKVQRSIESGEIAPSMTVSDARRLVTGNPDAPVTEVRTVTPGPKPGFDPQVRLPADLVASELCRTDRSTLAPSVEYLLRRWLDPPPPKETKDA